MSALKKLVRDGATYLENSVRCPKHHVEHTGSLCYLLDFYDLLGESAKAKSHIEHLLSLVTDTPAGTVFYPGHLDPMNMSQNVIDTGAAVDCIARYLERHRDQFSAEEHAQHRKALERVAESYLKTAAAEKYITNQRLWGLTGLASYARYARTHAYDALIRTSIEKAFADMTEDGFFLYMPHARAAGNFEGYEGITEFYQSRCTAFIRYTLDVAGLDVAPYEERLRKSERALLAMYRADGTKDLRLECKRWYWLSDYEVAASGFDAYALAHSREPAAAAALENALYQVRRHFSDGYLHSHIGARVNFQCPIFWTAHLAWLLRAGVDTQFDAAGAPKAFAFRFEGKEVFADTNGERRVLVNARWQARNFNEGIFDNGLPENPRWLFRIPGLPPALFLCVRETANHTWYALRGGYVREAVARVALFLKECFVMLLPRYDARYGRITSFELVEGAIIARVYPGSKYGTMSDTAIGISVPL